MGTQMPSLIILLIGIAYGIGSTEAKAYCWNFEGIDMTNTGMLPWRFSATGSVPDTTSIPSFSASSNYAWLQDNYGPPNTGNLVTTPDTGVTIFPGDVVSIEIFRHIMIDDGSFRPVLNFVQMGSLPRSQNILWSYNQNNWDIVQLICGPEAEPCCLTYPCNGYFSIDGSILAREELLAVDNLQVDDGCTNPNTCHCNFNSADLCSWSLSGWVWSYTYPTTDPPASTTLTEFIYVKSTTPRSGYASSPLITGVTSTSSFLLDYYLEDSNPTSNNFRVFFEDMSGSSPRRVYFSADLPTTGGAWIATSYTCSSLYDDQPCCTSYPCDGTFHVETTDYSGTQIAGIDDFVVSHAIVVKDPLGETTIS